MLNQNEIISPTEEITIKDILRYMKRWVDFLRKKWFYISILGVLGLGIGFLYAFLTPSTYKAKLSFVVEENRSGVGGLASLAGQFGLDVAGSSVSGVLSGENLLLFLKSSTLTKETLLTIYDSTGKTTLADKYADIYGYKKKWVKNSYIGKEIFFNTKKLDRIQDSLLQILIDRIIDKQLDIQRPEKKATFIFVETIMKDELLSSLFCQRLVQNAADRYIQSKTKRQRINLERLQRRADSIENVLNNRTYSSASEQERVIDLNPATRTPTVKLEVTNRDKIMLVTLYGEVVKNLEIAKMQLSQETPTIQIVDNAELPLVKSKSQDFLFSVVGFLLFIFLGITYFTAKRLVFPE